MGNDSERIRALSDNGWGIPFDFSSATGVKKRVYSSHKSIIVLCTTHLIKLGEC